MQREVMRMSAMRQLVECAGAKLAQLNCSSDAA